MPELDVPPGFVLSYGVDLLYETPPDLSKEALLQGIRKYCPTAEPVGDLDNGRLLAFSHPDYLVALKDGTIPAQTVLIPAPKPFELSEAMSMDLAQSWSFPKAAKVVARCHSSVHVKELMSFPLAYKERLELFQRALAGVLKVVPPLAIHWRPTGRFVHTASFLKMYRKGSDARFHAGALNVRLFKIEQSPGEMIMDTLGLAALGLPDFQCHFRGLNPPRVATLLGGLGYYVYEQGDVIETGHTVEGLTRGSRWRCQHEESILEPARLVLDIDPGPPYAAGNRDREQGEAG